ncbi:MAG TPA: ABC transporter permease, partial [Spirochaetia bacterium]|nr:ABC transporter permease [Spirochaetia bacterium]
GGNDSLFAQAKEAAAKANLILERGENVDQLKKEVADGNLAGLLVLPADLLSAKSYDYFSKTGTDVIVSETLSGIFGTQVVAERLGKEGLDPTRIAYLSSRPSLVVKKVGSGGVASSTGFTDILFTVMGFVMMLYMTVLLYGQMIGRSVVTEKTSKTVEIMLSSVRPMELLFGKILGKGLAGLLQYGIWIGVALILVRIVGPGLHVKPPEALTLGNLGILLGFFVLAFFLYSAAYGALGAGSEDEQHLTQLAWPLLIFLIVPLVAISSFVMDPGSTFSVVLSFFPMTAPIVMLIRILVSTPPLWQILVSIGILVLTIFAFVSLAAKIFRVGILMTGKRFGLGEILKWVRY